MNSPSLIIFPHIVLGYPDVSIEADDKCFINAADLAEALNKAGCVTKNDTYPLLVDRSVVHKLDDIIKQIAAERHPATPVLSGVYGNPGNWYSLHIASEYVFDEDSIVRLMKARGIKVKHHKGIYFSIEFWRDDLAHVKNMFDRLRLIIEPKRICVECVNWLDECEHCPECTQRLVELNQEIKARRKAGERVTMLLQ